MSVNKSGKSFCCCRRGRERRAVDDGSCAPRPISLRENGCPQFRSRDRVRAAKARRFPLKFPAYVKTAHNSGVEMTSVSGNHQPKTIPSGPSFVVRTNTRKPITALTQISMPTHQYPVSGDESATEAASAKEALRHLCHKAGQLWHHESDKNCNRTAPAIARNAG